MKKKKKKLTIICFDIEYAQGNKTSWSSHLNVLQSQGQGHVIKKGLRCSSKFNAYCLLSCQEHSTLVVFFGLCRPTVALHQGQDHWNEHEPGTFCSGNVNLVEFGGYVCHWERSFWSRMRPWWSLEGMYAAVNILLENICDLGWDWRVCMPLKIFFCWSLRARWRYRRRSRSLLCLL